MRKYREYTDKQFIESSKQVRSISQLLKRLNLKACGGNYIHAKKTIQRLNVDTNHWTGQGWSKDQQLKDWNKYTRIVNLKKHLIKEKGHHCEKCKLEEWNKFPIPLEVHHLDGNRANNKLKNLELLCCNCHALTKNWRNRK